MTSQVGFTVGLLAGVLLSALGFVAVNAFRRWRQDVANEWDPY
jgi:hypothetical protein